MSHLLTDRTKVRRIPDRGKYQEHELFEILDSSFLCHIAFCEANDLPVLIPTAYGHDKGFLYIHGATTSRMIKRLEEGAPLCFCVTIVDALVLARSAFHHSLNYRSVIVFGTAEKVEGEEKNRGLKIISDQILKGRWEEARPPNKKELKATTVLKIQVIEGSAKVRTGPPKDDAEDYSLDTWAGILPLRQQPGKPVDDPTLLKPIPLPDSVLNFLKNG
ncbi:MAG: pyridoxamine 5'-phosphate oxidase family protein [Cyclobacteriaceae bacterium]|nr:pyridoxamine 5'-phosphate oxidase family protein [Cyclobacteriaceae bacterium]